MVKNFYDILIYAVEFLVSFAFITRNFEKRLSKTIYVLLIGFPLFLFCAHIFNKFDNEIVNLLLFFLINFIFFISCYKISISEALVYSIILDVVMFGAELITIYFLSFCLSIEVTQYKNNLGIFAICALVSKILYFVLSQIILIIISKIKQKSMYSTKYLPLFIFPVIIIAVSLLFLKITLTYNIDDKFLISAIIIIILFIIACIIIYVYYEMMLKNEYMLKQLIVERQYEELNKNYMEILKHQNDKMSVMFQDTKNHYLTIGNLDNVEDIHKYIKNICSDMEKYDVINRTQNQMLNLILSKYYTLCSKNDIKFTVEVKTVNLSYINDTDLSTLLNNLLDNAFEASKNSKEKVIDFSLRHVNDFDVLSLINSCDVAPQSESGRLLTTKNDKLSHGYGTKIIRKYIKKYNGKSEWEFDKENSLFHFTILFPNSN